MTEEERYIEMLSGFLFGTDDGRRPIRGRFIVARGQRPPAEIPTMPSGRGVTVDAGTPGARTAELFAVEAAHAIEERETMRYQRAALRERRHGGGVDFR